MDDRLLMSLQAHGEKKCKASFSLQLAHSAPRRCGEAAEQSRIMLSRYVSSTCALSLVALGFGLGRCPVLNA